MLDVAVNNAWILQRRSGVQVSQLEFRRSVVQTYLKRYQNRSRGPGRPSTSIFSVSMNRVSDDLRYDGRSHLLIQIPDKKRRRCAEEGCSTSARTMCLKCNVGICIECNVIFHSKTK